MPAFCGNVNIVVAVGDVDAFIVVLYVVPAKTKLFDVSNVTDIDFIDTLFIIVPFNAVCLSIVFVVTEVKVSVPVVVTSYSVLNVTLLSILSIVTFTLPSLDNVYTFGKALVLPINICPVVRAVCSIILPPDNTIILLLFNIIDEFVLKTGTFSEYPIDISEFKFPHVNLEN